ncbi:hypothetical protein M0R72_19045 [Candidatus Pacearchaeota archaeon]|jgi:hypothetical protein|nr:hypothetical protein [Candidatus Pacearchaeota archaeon]
MNWKEGLTILASLTAVLGFGLTILDEAGPDDAQPPNVAPPPHKIVILARTAFNDSGNAYAEEFNGEIIRLNDSMRVVYLV